MKTCVKGIDKLLRLENFQYVKCNKRLKLNKVFMSQKWLCLNLKPTEILTQTEKREINIIDFLKVTTTNVVLLLDGRNCVENVIKIVMKHIKSIKNFRGSPNVLYILLK